MLWSPSCCPKLTWLAAFVKNAFTSGPVRASSKVCTMVVRNKHIYI